MADPVAELQLSDYVDIARRRWKILVIGAAVALGLAIAYSASQTPLYRAQARVRVEGTQSVDNFGDSFLSSNVRDRNLENEVEFARSDRVLKAAFEQIEPGSSVSVSRSGGSDTLVFSSVSTDPAQAAAVANTFADAYVTERSEASLERFVQNERIITDRLAELAEERQRLEAQLEADPGDSSLSSQLASLDAEEVRRNAQLTELGIVSELTRTASVSLLNAATEPGAAFSPSWARNIALGLVAGTILGIGVALLLETLDDTILSKRDLEQAAELLPVIGTIPPPWKGRRKRKRHLVTTRSGAFTESFRGLRSAIELGQAGSDDIRSILVTSAGPAEGKSTVVSHLALSFARAGERVLVVDADMHNPTQHEMFGVENVNGLAEHLSNLAEAQIVTERMTGEGLVELIPAGSSESSPAELLSSPLAQEMIHKLAAVYDVVLIDSPPVRAVADTLPLARFADATLLVVMRGKSTDREVEQGLELLARSQTVPLGTILCGADHSDSGYGYGYGYGENARNRAGSRS